MSSADSHNIRRTTRVPRKFHPEDSRASVPPPLLTDWLIQPLPLQMRACSTCGTPDILINHPLHPTDLSKQYSSWQPERTASKDLCLWLHASKLQTGIMRRRSVVRVRTCPLTQSSVHSVKRRRPQSRTTRRAAYGFNRMWRQPDPLTNPSHNTVEALHIT